MRRRSRVEADALSVEFEQSGMGRKEFSAMRGLSVHTLDAYRKRARKGRRGSPLLAVEVEPSPRPITSVPSCRVSVVLANGRRIDFVESVDTALLQELIAVAGVIFGVGAATKVYLAAGATDMRKGV